MQEIKGDFTASCDIPVTDGTHSASYSYLANSSLVEQILFTENSTTRMTTTKEYDLLNRLTAIESSSSSFSSSSSYQYNTANQRTSITNADGSYWTYTYDDLGQVISGKKRWGDGTLVAGQQFEYGFDDIGNRTNTASGGNASGTSLRSAVYGANLLNQYDVRSVPPQVSVIGEADADATVTVNLASTVRKGEYWWGEAVAANGGGPVWLAITNIAVLEDGANPHIVATNVGRTRVAQTLEEFTHDDDGNLTSDSLWVNTWNAENRRTVVESSAAVPAAGRAREQWTYLPDGRWIERIVSTWNTNTLNYRPSTTNRFVWDGNVLLAVLNRTNGVELAFARGLDLSGSLQGAGGGGGLLWITQHSTPQPSTHFAAYDGNGNVMALVDAATGEESARYEYGPFGEVLRMTGPMADVNPIRFSTQYADDETGDLKYLYRDYRADLGRWLSRDLVEEKGGANVYAFLGNATVNGVDRLGLAAVFDVSVIRRYNVQGLVDKYGHPSGATTDVVRERIRHRSRDCGSGRKQVTDVLVVATVLEQYSMSETISHRYLPGTLVSYRTHEDQHAGVFYHAYRLRYLGRLLIYRACVCKPCYDQWTEYLDAIDQYAVLGARYQNSGLDCDTYNHPGACAERDELRAQIPSIDENMYLQGQRLLEACGTHIKVVSE